MKPPTLRLLAFASFLFPFGLEPLCAELQWDTQTIDLKPLPTDSVAEAKFGFVNAGRNEVTIESVKSSCGCTVPTLAKTVYAPGERAEVTARFTIGDRRGAQTTTIRVAVKGEREPALLTLNVTIPEVATLTPPMLLWEPGEKPAPKTIDVDAMANQPMRVVKVRSSSPDFDASVETIEEAVKYRIVVTPRSAARRGFALLNIETRLTEGAKTLQAYAQVRSNTPAAPMAALPPRPESAAEIEPAVLAWDQGSAPAAQTFAVRVPVGGSAKISKVTASTANFDARLEPVVESSEYRITVTPKSTAKPELAFLRIDVETGAGKVIQRAYVQIASPAK